MVSVDNNLSLYGCKQLHPYTHQSITKYYHVGNNADSTLFFVHFSYISIKEVIDVKAKDLTESFYDSMMSILFKYIKDLINWDQVQNYIPKNLMWYSSKKKCQLLLAMADANSYYCAKYNSNDDVAASMREAIYYLNNFRPTRSVMYMKAYRKQYLVDIFDVFCHRYDNVLKTAKYSHEEALSIIKMHEADLLMAVANNIKDDYKNIIESSTTEEEFIDNNKFVIDLCEELQAFTNLFSQNCKRISTNVIFTLFDIQSLYNMAFDPAFKTFQTDKYNEFELVKMKKIVGEIITAIMQAIHGIIESAYVSESKFDKQTQNAIKIHRLAIPEENDDIYEIRISCYDPMIITT